MWVADSGMVVEGRMYEVASSGSRVIKRSLRINNNYCKGGY